MKIKTVILVILMCMFVTSCAKPNTEESDMPSADVSSEGSDITPSDSVTAETYSANNFLQLKKIKPKTNNAIVLVKGYYAPNDGGGGMFYWDAESELPADDGIVVKPNNTEKGRFIRNCESDYRNVKWFGASGKGITDDHAAITRAINSLSANGGTVVFPGGTYNISKTIQIGNGDGELNRSDINGITLRGEGAGFGVYGKEIPTCIKASMEMDALIKINGRISDVTIEGIDFSGNYNADTVMRIQSVYNLTLREVLVGHFNKYGIYIVGGKGDGNGNNHCKFESVCAITVVDNTVCLCIDGEDTTCDSSEFTFIDCRFDAHTTQNSTAALLKKATAMSFYRCHMVRSNETSNCLVLDAEGNNGYPFGNNYYDCSIGSVLVKESDGFAIGSQWFLGYGTYDMETIPEHPMLSGITDSGIPFGLGKGE